MIPHEELRVETWPPRQRGGQQVVGIRDVGVRVEHLPSGTVAISTACRSQHSNREVAMEMILSAITHPRFGR